jgi:hypothetical protein
MSTKLMLMTPPSAKTPTPPSFAGEEGQSRRPPQRGGAQRSQASAVTGLVLLQRVQRGLLLARKLSQLGQ